MTAMPADQFGLADRGRLKIGHAADVVVLPSRWEGLSYVVLEAIACGRSVVACDVAGMREALSDGPADADADAGSDAGALVEPGNTSALADAVACRLADPDLAAREGARARTRAAHFDLGEWGDRWAELIEGAVAQHRAGVSP